MLRLLLVLVSSLALACSSEDDPQIVDSGPPAERDAAVVSVDAAARSDLDAALDAALDAEKPDASCPGIDTDRDGTPDACDGDDDDDGFDDGSDPAPLDDKVPGKFKSPEDILADPRVKKALDAARDAGATLVTSTERTPLDVTGYYAAPDGEGSFLVTGDGTDRGRKITGSEARMTARGDLVDSVSVSFTSGKPLSFGTTLGQQIRGSADEITLYTRSVDTCTEGGSNYKMWSVSIQSAKVDPTTGNWTMIQSLVVNVGVQGTLTSTCASRYAGNFEVVDGWAVSQRPRQNKVDVGTLRFLCVDEGRGYAPPETWTRASGEQCECSQSYKISCGGARDR